MSEKETKRAANARRERGQAKTNQTVSLCEKEEPWIKHQEGWDPSPGCTSVTEGKLICTRSDLDNQNNKTIINSRNGSTGLCKEGKVTVE